MPGYITRGEESNNHNVENLSKQNKSNEDFMNLMNVDLSSKLNIIIILLAILVGIKINSLIKK
tara:strand:- start:250 stop:438 length:189 start_codon:yes stop_codon:yes gene_type:complete